MAKAQRRTFGEINLNSGVKNRNVQASFVPDELFPILTNPAQFPVADDMSPSDGDNPSVADGTSIFGRGPAVVERNTNGSHDPEAGMRG